MPKVIESLDAFEAELAAAGDKAVIVDFHATWCGPCKMISPKFIAFAEEHAATIVTLKVDVDVADDVAEKYGIQAMPTFMVFKNGKKVDEMKGANAEKLQEMFNKNK